MSHSRLFCKKLVLFDNEAISLCLSYIQDNWNLFHNNDRVRRFLNSAYNEFNSMIHGYSIVVVVSDHERINSLADVWAGKQPNDSLGKSSHERNYYNEW